MRSPVHDRRYHDCDSNERCGNDHFHVVPPDRPAYDGTPTQILVDFESDEPAFLLVFRGLAGRYIADQIVVPGFWRCN
jgi:hypothetical protein